MRAGKNFILLFIIIAYSITLLHTMVPHQHFNPVSSEVTVQASGCNSLVGFFKILFAADLGENHLEKFQQKNFADLNLSFAGILLFSVVSVLLFQIRKIFLPADTTFVEKLHRKLLLSSSKLLRAPPAVV